MPGGRGAVALAVPMGSAAILVLVSLLIFALALVLLVGLAYVALKRDAGTRAEIGWGRFGARFSVCPHPGPDGGSSAEATRVDEQSRAPEGRRRTARAPARGGERR